MAALLGNPLLLTSAASGSGDEAYKIEKSIRLNDTDDSCFKSYLKQGNERQATYSTWWKYHKYTGTTWLFGFENHAGDTAQAYFQSGYIILYFYETGGSNSGKILDKRTHWVNRDHGAWVHIVINIDTTKSQAGERGKIFINGVEQSYRQQYENTGEVFHFGKPHARHYIGAASNNDNAPYGFTEANIADSFWLDGLVVGPAAFGQWDSKGIWTPKKFELPRPNTGTTWSSGTFKDPSNNNITWSNVTLASCFDGVNDTGASTGIYPNADVDQIWSGINIPIKSALRIQANRNGTPGNVKVTTDTGTAETYISGSSTSGMQWWWIDIPRGSTKITEIRFPKASGTGFDWNAIEVDGQQLIDGRTDSTWAEWSAINNGKIRSLHEATGSFYSGYGLHNAFKGHYVDSALSAVPADDAWAGWKPKGDVVASSSIRVFLSRHGDLSGITTWVKNCDVDITSTVTSAIASGAQGWVTLPTTGGAHKVDAANGFVVYRRGSDGHCIRIHAIEVDGVILQDGNVNSYHLPYNTSAGVDRFLGRDVLQGKLAAATGAKPILVATDVYGDATAGVVNTTDNDPSGNSVKSSLVLAVSGQGSIADVHHTVKGSGSAHSATVTGCTIKKSTGRLYDESIFFDGSDDKLDFGDHDDWDFGTGDYCVEGWFYTDNTTGYVPLIAARDSSGWRLQFTPSDNWKVKWGGGGADIVESEANGITRKSWHHIAATRSGSTVRLFIDGKLVDTGTDSNTTDAGGNLEIGDTWPSGMSQFSGNMQDIRIYKGAAKYTSEFVAPVRNSLEPINLTSGGSTSFKLTNVPHNFKEAIYTGTAGPDSGGTPATGTTLRSLLSATGAPGGSGARNHFFSYVNSGTDNEQIIEYSPSISTTSEFSVYAGSYNNGSVAWTVTITYDDDTTASSSGNSGSNTWYDRSSFSTSGKSVKKVRVTAASYSNFLGVTVDNSNNVIRATNGNESDLSVDTPTPYTPDDGETGNGGDTRGNYCTINPSTFDEHPTQSTNIELRQGNLYVVGTAGSVWGELYGSMAVHSSGKWYYECKLGPATGTVTNHIGGLGVCNPEHTFKLATANAKSGSYMYEVDGDTRTSGSHAAAGLEAWAIGDVIGVKLDLDASPKTITFLNNNVSLTTINITSDDTNNEFIPIWRDYTNSATLDGWFNFGQRGFIYPQTGYQGWCTHLLPDTFDGEDDEFVNNPIKYFDNTIWTGTGATKNVVDYQFQPDLVWIKNRNSAWAPTLTDAVRGAGKQITSNNTDTQTTNYSNGYVSSFDSNGFTLTNGSSSGEALNKSGDSIVAWCWDAGSSQANTDGSYDVPSGKQYVNAAAGFSITESEMSGSDITVGHGLGAEPSLIITKNYDTSDIWCLYHKSLGKDKYCFFHDTHVPFTDTNDAFTSTNSSIFDLRQGLFNSGTHISYAWAPIRGYSSFGDYTGNGKLNGPFLYCGFSPRLVILKRTDATNDWMVYDRARDPYNGDDGMTKLLKSNESGAETSGTTEDNIAFLSNGFKILEDNNGMNAASGSYIYMAWAEHPYKTAKAHGVYEK